MQAVPADRRAIEHIEKLGAGGPHGDRPRPVGRIFGKPGLSETTDYRIASLSESTENATLRALRDYFRFARYSGAIHHLPDAVFETPTQTLYQFYSKALAAESLLEAGYCGLDYMLPICLSSAQFSRNQPLLFRLPRRLDAW